MKSQSFVHHVTPTSIKNSARSVLCEGRNCPRSPPVCSSKSKMRLLSRVRSSRVCLKEKRRTKRCPTCLVFICSVTPWVSVFQCHVLDECPDFAGFHYSKCLSLSVQRAYVCLVLITMRAIASPPLVLRFSHKEGVSPKKARRIRLCPLIMSLAGRLRCVLHIAY